MRLARTLMMTATAGHNLLCALPLLCVAALYALVGRAAMLLGHWPQVYSGNDAVYRFDKGDWLYQALFLGMVGLVGTAFLSAPLWLVFTFALRARYSLKGRWGRVALYGVGWLACVGVVVFDPGRYMAWLWFTG